MNLIKSFGLILFIGFFNPVLKCQTDSVNSFIQVQDVWDLDFNKGTAMVDYFLTIKYRQPLEKEIYLLYY